MAYCVYSKFVVMQSHGVAQQFNYQIFTVPEYESIECTLWRMLYYHTTFCDSLVWGKTNRLSGKINFLHKMLSPVVDYSLDFEVLQHQYNRWLFKTITGTITPQRHQAVVPTPLFNQTHFRQLTGSGSISTSWTLSASTAFLCP